MRRLRRLLLIAPLLLASSTAALAGVEVGLLRKVSAEVVELYNRSDAAGLHERLAPTLRTSWPIDKLAERLDDCRRRFGTLKRVSLPVSGTTSFGFIAAYFETAVRDMFLEIDPDGFIRMLTFAGPDGTCALSRR